METSDGFERLAWSFSKEEEDALLERFKKNDPFARLKLEREVSAHLRQYVVKKRRTNSILSDAAYVNEVIVQLPRIVADYDTTRNASFKAYVEQRANGLVQNLNDTYVPGSSMNRNERPMQAKYNMAKQYVEGVTPGGRASDKDVLKRIEEQFGEKWDARKLGVAKKLNVVNLRTNLELGGDEGLSHRDQFAGGGVKGDRFYDQRERKLHREEVAKYDPGLDEDERRMVLSYLRTGNKTQTSIETNETLYRLNQALNKFEGLLDE